ncbi:MAG: tetratricopeptide repeat protein [Saprospiraceae bacterium]|nr:tetratricopeptide repeat protein [Saprospiraceae bacterium]
MKYAILFLLVSTLTGVSAQTVDSDTIKRVDSLIKVSRELTGKKDFQKALELNAIAEKLALEKFGKESAAYGSCCFNRGRVSRNKGDYPEAEKWYLESKAIREKVLGKEHPDYALNLTSLAILYKDMGNYEKAEPLYLESKAIREKVLGKEHPDYASSLNSLAILYKDMGNYEKAEPLYIEAKAIREKVLGKEHPDYASSLNSLAILYKDMGNYEKAEPLYLESTAIREKVLGKEHPDYASSLNNLATLYKYMGNYEKAEPLCLKAKTIREKVLGKEHPDYASSLNSLANLYKDMGNYEKAEPLCLESKAIREKVLGKEHRDYASSLYNLAILYKDMGNYEKAEPLYLESKAIREKVLGKEHPDYTSSLNSLATLYKDMGNYEKAEPLYIEAKAIREKVSGKENLDYANSLNNLANLYLDLGNYEKAEPLYIEAKTIREKVSGKELPDYARSLNNLAILYSRIGKYEKSEPLYLKAKPIFEKVVGKESLDYAVFLENFADFVGNIGNYEKAEPLYLEAKNIYEKVLGKEHPVYAISLTSLAILYKNLGNYEKAERLCLEAKPIFEKVLGKENPNNSSNLGNLADLYERLSRFSLSAPLLAEVYSLNQARLSKAISFLSEQELAIYTATFQKQADALGSYILARLTPGTIGAEFDQAGILPALQYSNALFYKGFLLTATTQINTLLASTPETQEINLRLKSYRRRLAVEYAKPIADRKNVAELEEKTNSAEKELARTMAGYAEAKRQVKWEEVMSTLKKEEATIEFVSFKVNFPRFTDSLMYAALLLKPDESQPIFISLFEEKSLDSLLQLNAERKTDYVNNLYSIAGRGAVALETPKRTLYEMIWEPIEKYMEGIKTIYFSPSGLLHRINLDAIPVSESETLADKYRLIELNSTRQLVIPDQVEIVNNDAVLYGGIQFEADTTFHKNEPVIASRSRGELSFSSVDSSLRGGSWNYLPGTAREINSIESILKKSKVKITLKTGYSATEESFKNFGANNTSSPQILHIATHGYFFEDLIKSSQKSEINSQNENVFKMSDHPMLRSGLIMAGGNATWQGKQTLEGREDGILTAYEISQMNLSNTELVVLSACETGLGEIQGNEGVYGLQRAFKIAGAKYLIMSLWQVPDKQTSLLMTTFYKKWLNAEGPDNGGKKMTIPDAFHAAQKELREIGLDPYQWAGFVLME